MDPRRRLSLALCALGLSGCALGLRDGPDPARTVAAAPAEVELAAVSATPPAGLSVRAFAAMAPIPNPAPRDDRPPPSPPEATGRAAIAAANLRARARSRADDFEEGVQVFAYGPGRVYEVWTAPLRVTTVTLAPGEMVIAKAAGDTLRWQIGETTSGEGPGQRTQVMIKPLQRGLETNLVLATSRRTYMLQLRSGAPEAFNAAVTWDVAVAPLPAAGPTPAPEPPAAAPVPPLAMGPLDAGYRIAPQGRRPVWTPVAVMTDGARTYLAFPPALAATEAPALFALSPGGETQLVNYRQRGGLWVVDRVLDAAELRLGGRHPQVVRIQRTGGAS